MFCSVYGDSKDALKNLALAVIAQIGNKGGVIGGEIEVGFFIFDDQLPGFLVRKR